jgi:hypothetical protein
MKKFNQLEKKREFLSLISCMALLFLLFFTSPAGGEEAHQDISQTLRVEEKKLENLLLTEIFEDKMIIDEKQYLLTYNTKIYRKDNSDRVKIGEIVLPCLVDIIYKIYSVYTEGYPFRPGERVLSSVFIKKENLETMPLSNNANKKNGKQEIEP